MEDKKEELSLFQYEIKKDYRKSIFHFAKPGLVPVRMREFFWHQRFGEQAASSSWHIAVYKDRIIHVSSVRVYPVLTWNLKVKKINNIFAQFYRIN